MTAGSHFGCPKSLCITFLTIFFYKMAAGRISGHFRSIRNFFFTNFFIFAKWPPAPILDVRNSLSIAFLAISDRYATLIFFFLIFFFVNCYTKWLPAAILDVRKSLSVAFLAHLRSIQIFLIFYKMAAVAILDVRKSLSISFLAISDRYAPLFFLEFFYGHFGCPKFTLDHISSHFISIQIFYLFFIFLPKAAGGHFGCPKITFDLHPAPKCTNDVNVFTLWHIYEKLITSPPIGGGRGIVMPMSVCLSVCLSVCVFVCLSVFSQNFKV